MQYVSRTDDLWEIRIFFFYKQGKILVEWIINRSFGPLIFNDLNNDLLHGMIDLMIKGIQEETYPSNYISLRKERTEEKRKERKKKEEKWQRNKKDAFIYIYINVCVRVK